MYIWKLYTKVFFIKNISRTFKIQSSLHRVFRNAYPLRAAFRKHCCAACCLSTIFFPIFPALLEVTGWILCRLPEGRVRRPWNKMELKVAVGMPELLYFSKLPKAGNGSDRSEFLIALGHLLTNPTSAFVWYKTHWMQKICCGFSVSENTGIQQMFH